MFELFFWKIIIKTNIYENMYFRKFQTILYDLYLVSVFIFFINNLVKEMIK